MRVAAYHWPPHFVNTTCWDNDTVINDSAPGSLLRVDVFS